MVLNSRASLFLKLLTAIIVGWGGLVFSSAADAHEFPAYIAGDIGLDQLSAAEESDPVPGGTHEDDRHCHGSGPLCHIHLALYSGKSEWTLRSASISFGQRPALRKDRDVVPPHRPPRSKRHIA